MVSAVHAFGEWLFFDYAPVSPLGMFGTVSVGWWLHVAVARRRRTRGTPE